MMKKGLFTDNIINFVLNCLEANYGIKAINITSLPLGADMNAQIFKATTQENAYFVKLKQGHHHDTSVKIVMLLDKIGIKVIPPVKTIDGQSIQRIEEFTLIVYPFISGQDGFKRPLTETQWENLGKSLRKLHEINVPTSIEHQLRHENYSPQWREKVKLYLNQIENKTIQGTIQGEQDEITLKLTRILKTKMTIILQLVNRSERLAEIIADQSPQYVLCHSDIHGGNVLIDDNGSIYLVDWDDPIMAPKERDLMFIGGGVANVWNKPEEAVSFYKGYGEVTINNTILAYYRHERIVEDIALYIQALLLTNGNVTNVDDMNRTVMYKQFIDLFEPNGVVDIAFKTVYM